MIMKMMSSKGKYYTEYWQTTRKENGSIRNVKINISTVGWPKGQNIVAEKE